MTRSFSMANLRYWISIWYQKKLRACQSLEAYTRSHKQWIIVSSKFYHLGQRLETAILLWCNKDRVGMDWRQIHHLKNVYHWFRSEIRDWKLWRYHSKKSVSSDIIYLWNSTFRMLGHFQTSQEEFKKKYALRQC